MIYNSVYYKLNEFIWCKIYIYGDLHKYNRALILLFSLCYRDLHNLVGSFFYNLSIKFVINASNEKFEKIFIKILSIIYGWSYKSKITISMESLYSIRDSSYLVYIGLVRISVLSFTTLVFFETRSRSFVNI